MKNSIRLYITLMAVALMASARSDAQTSPVYSVPTPEAAGLGTYGSVPVSLFTGVPDISVPIHEMKVGSMTFPVSLTYHLASVKPNVYPGKVGLGWSLQCGGCISRTVRGVPDEKRTDNHNNGFYGNSHRMANMTGSTFANLTERFANTDDSSWFELSADEFSFNFFGHSGNFYLNSEGGWTVVSDEDIKVEFDPGSGFINILDLAERIPGVVNWPNRSGNMRHFIRFTLVTPDGCRFTFGGKDATDFSVPYYSRKTGDLVATSWYLSEIRTPDGRTVRYEYANVRDGKPYDLMVDIRYSPGTCWTLWSTSDTDGNGFNTGRKGFTGFLLYPARLTSITTPNETLTFEYKPDWRYSESYYSNYTGGALYWSEDGQSRTSLWHVYDSAPHEQFTYLFPQFMRSTDSEANMNIASALSTHVLYGIQIDRPGDDDTTVLMEYKEESRRKLNRVVWRTGLVNISTTHVNGGGVMYPFYHIPDETTSLDMPEYRFVYNPNRMPKGYVLPQADRWGYWNGMTHSLATYNPDVTPSVIATRSETLTEVIYPTGGRSVFEYEGHDYSRKESPNHILLNSNGIVGGLRVHSITNLTRENSMVSTKVYHYREDMSRYSRSSGIARAEDPVSVTYKHLNPQDIEGSRPDSVLMQMTGMYAFGNPVTNLNSPDVGYSCVIEETLDAEGNSLGYIVNRFSNYGTDIHGNVHDDVPAYYSCNITRSGSGLPYTSNSAERGHLLSRSWHRADSSEVRTESYRYTRVNDHPMVTATQRTIYMNHNPSNVISATVGWLTMTNTFSYLLSSTEVHEGDYSEHSFASYNDSRMVVSQSVLSSGSSPRTTSFTYPSDHLQQYQWMVDLHMLSPVVSEEVSHGNLKRKVINSYSQIDSFNGPICYQSRKETLFGHNGPVKTDYEVLSVDEWGNPTEIVEDGIHSVLQWNRNGQCLMTRAEDMTLDEYEALPALSGSVQMQSDDSMVHPLLPDPVQRYGDGKMIWRYTYDPSLRLVRMTSPDGMTNLYRYDRLGRLSEESLLETGENGQAEIKTLKKYEYHYHND